MTAAKSTTSKSRRPAKAAAAPATAAEPAAEATAALTRGDAEWVEKHTALARGEVPSAIEAEVDLEDIPDGAVAVPLGPHGDLVHILPRTQWRSSALSALHSGNLELWASLCLIPADYERVWIGVDPTVNEVDAMLQTWTQLTGESVGKAPVARGSLRGTRSR